MTKLSRLNRIAVAAAWLSDRLGDKGITEDYLIELGRLGRLPILAAVPPDLVMLPKGIKAPGLLHTPVLDGIVELDRLQCHVLQAQGFEVLDKAALKGFTYPLAAEVTLNLGMLRVKQEDLERFASDFEKQAIRRTSKDQQTAINHESPPAIHYQAESSAPPSEKTHDRCARALELRKTHDIHRERGCRRLILENWDLIEQLHGPSADGRQVKRILDKKLDSSQAAPTLKTVQNKLSVLRNEGLIP